MLKFFCCCIPRTPRREVYSLDLFPKVSPVSVVTPSLSELEIFLTDEESRMMIRIANDSSISTKFSELLVGGFNFSLKKNQTPEVCETLYWGYKNGKLNATEFLERYNQALIVLCFFPQEMPFPLNTQGELAKNIKIITSDELPIRILQSIKPQLNELYRKSGINKKTDYFVKVTFSDSMRKALEDNRWNEYTHCYQRGESDAPYPQLMNYGFWFHILHTEFKFFILDTVDYREMFIPSFLLMQAMATELHGVDSTFAQPNFGSGSWEQLASMRKSKGQPTSLFFPKNSTPSFRPDGFWLGSMAHYHDFYHTNRVNIIDFTMQKKLILLDEICVQPLLSLSEKLAHISSTDNLLTVKELRFIDGYKQLVQIWLTQKRVKKYDATELLQSLDQPNNLDESMKKAFGEYTKNPFRTLIDQEEPAEILLNNFKRSELNLDVEKPDLSGTSFTSQYMIHELILSEHSDEMLQLLKLAIVRDKEYSESFPQSINKPNGEIDITATQQIVFQWYMSYWMSFLSENRLPLATQCKQSQV
ncbi:MAG: hypothetical protein HAW66_04345 [Shewanella sp.]|nr:hypothetical protein [Shewanella sp.]